MDILTVATWVFSAALVAGLLVMILGITWIFVEALMFVIRMFVPNFAVYRPHKAEHTQHLADRKTIHLVALDTVLKMRRDRETQMKQAQKQMAEEFTRRMEADRRGVFNGPEDLTEQLAAIAAGLTPPPDVHPSAEYHLVNFVNGAPHYAASIKSPQGGQSRATWLTIGSSMWLRFSRADAVKWSEALGCCFSPANSAARLYERHLAILHGKETVAEQTA